MLTFIARRLLALIPLMLIVSFLVFSLVVFLPGDPAQSLAGGPDAAPADVERVRDQLGLDDPLAALPVPRDATVGLWRRWRVYGARRLHHGSGERMAVERWHVADAVGLGREPLADRGELRCP